MKLTFCKQPRETGRMSVVFPHPITDIKAEGKVVGQIRYDRERANWGVLISVAQKPTEKDPCPFRWAWLKVRAGSEAEARQVVKSQWAAIQAKYSLHQFED